MSKSWEAGQREATVVLWKWGAELEAATVVIEQEWEESLE